MAEKHPSEGSTPTYTEWIQTTEGYIHALRFSATGLATFATVDTGQELTAEERRDPLIALPFFGLFTLSSVAEFNVYGLESLTRGDTYELPDSRLDDILVLPETRALAGDIDTESMEDTVLSSTAGADLEAIDTVGTFTIHSDPEGSIEPIAIGENGVVIPARDGPVTKDPDLDDPEQSLRDTLATFVDGSNRAVDENDEFEWLVAEAGHGTICIAEYGDNDADSDSADFEALSGLTGFVSSMAYDSGEFTSKFAGLLGNAQVDALRDSLGASADESSIDIDDEHVTATATWER